MSISGQALPITIDDVLSGSPYRAYTYSYPHKTAYRMLDVPVDLSELWGSENTQSLFLYLHVPFCEHRCGFCNLFTQAQPETGLTARYLQQLSAEAQVVQDATGRQAQYAQLAIGGGTPTFLETAELEQLLQISRDMGANGNLVPAGIEVSPATVTQEKLALLSEFGIERVSIGIQSFNEQESRRLGRPQKTADVNRALQLIQGADIPVLNIDLIYGGEGQSVSQWMSCVRETCRRQPQEIYLYPLYVRPLTGLGRQDRHWDDQRLDAYRAARDFLLENGFQQVSMRMFRQPPNKDSLPARPQKQQSVYRCQSDGMVGLGCGARSYTSAVHYSTEYAVGRQSVHSILLDYINRSRDQFQQACYGIQLTENEQQRRFVLLSLLQTEGLSLVDYQQRFGSDVLVDVLQLQELIDSGLASQENERIQLTESGMERSDAIGPWLYSDHVRSRMSDYELV